MKRMLITRQLTPQQRALALELALVVEEVPVLRYAPKFTPSLLAANLVRSTADAWLFTSAHASRAVAQVKPLLSPNFRPPQCFVVGEATAAPLLGLGWGVAIPDAHVATSLAQQVAQAGIRQPAHWCGRERRPELRTRLNQLGVQLTEHIIYEMKAQPIQEVSAAVQAIACLSPRSGLQLPKELSTEITLVGIGPTTRQSLEYRYPHHTVLESPEASIEGLLHFIANQIPCTCLS